MQKCQAIKADGDQCTRRPQEGKTLCYQHVDKKAVTTVKQPEPWTLLGLPVPNEHNGKRYIQKIRTALNSSKKKKGGGYIYIYFLPREKTLNYWKIGYTERTVEERMSEWSAKYTIEVYTTFKVDSNVQTIEALIHLYLTYCRIYRYPNKHGYQSVYKLKPSEIIQDGQQNREEDERVVAKNKEIEWFCAPIREILNVVEPIIKNL